MLYKIKSFLSVAPKLVTANIKNGYIFGFCIAIENKKNQMNHYYRFQFCTALVAFTLLYLSTVGMAQTTITGTIKHDGLIRDYRLYIPKNFDSKKAVPLVFNFHGLTSNAQQQEFYGDFRGIADTAGFLLVHPTGTVSKTAGVPFWNVGLAVGESVDDVGFVEALIDSLQLKYTIDPNRIYATGMSNGGFMSYFLACSSLRFAAIASVTGYWNKSNSSFGSILGCKKWL